MNSRTIDVVTDWETVATPDGYEGLHELADAEFTGAVSAGMAWSFFLNGRVVGVFEGDIGDFEDAELTAYRAADPSLPLLFSMQERGGETQARYYTNKTPLSDADQTLSNGGFTGYIELSENVLSGDYYVVYHGGKSMSAAFVGSSERLVTGEEAFETAADEVGIYEVVDVDVEIVDIPELATDEAEAAEDDASSAESGADEGDAAGATEAADDATETTDDADTGDDATEQTTTAAPSATSDIGSTADSAGDGTPTDDGADGEPTTAGAEASEPSDAPRDEEPATAAGSPSDTAPERRTSDSTEASAETSHENERAVDASPDATQSDDRRASEPTPEDASGVGAADDGTVAGPTQKGDAADGVFSDEERWREAKTIPSLDPGETSSNGTTAQAASADQDRRSERERAAQMQRQRTAQKAAQSRTNASETADGSTAAQTTTSSAKQGEQPDVERLEKRLSKAKERVQSLESERDELAEARTKQRERIDELEAERETLKAEVERLESELERLGGGTGETPSQSMSVDRALSGTNLFVRYDRKGEATLEHAHDGAASRGDVSDNLRLEHHTTFETEGLAVDGQPYEAFLHDSTEYAFAQWVVTNLLYEIGETGNRSGLAGVFDAIPEIDRVELSGTVGVDTPDGVEQRDFDVIFRDKMGDPLFVADINASRNATTEAMVGSLVENTGTIASNDESLAAGFYVTESFYEPGALETVSEETGGGLLSRSKKLSHVKLSRKRGYHLCLVEARNGEFHLNVPDL